jgi:alcohol dehydrogenase
VDSIQGLRPDGRLVTMGADAEPIAVSLIDLISKRIRIIGSQQNGPEYLYQALDFVAQGKVKTMRRIHGRRYRRPTIAWRRARPDFAPS